MTAALWRVVHFRRDDKLWETSTAACRVILANENEKNENENDEKAAVVS